ncbi:squalene/phytoene synthase family protein [Candidatus Pelagibacter sp.]|nr:squalene/phytoene synthase family protein [Candidatus Pelagibacter bacterium]MDC0364122.1 squalene/phytoene synthase family protein [Candidatus Pelagibacter sp.]
MIKTNYLATFAKSFNWAGFFLPKDTYEECSKLYAFCRILDDVADSGQDLEIKKKKFNEIKDIIKLYEIRFTDNQDMLAVNDMIMLSKNKNIKKIILNDLIEGIESDLKKEVNFITIKELLVYSYRVAGTVGLMMTKILDVKDSRALLGAIDLGIAMQLTNIARDVIEDQKIGRKYIEGDFKNILATLQLADTFYESSFSSIKKIPFRYRFAILVARRVYRQIGRKITSKKNIENYRKSGKIYVNNYGKIYQTVLSLGDFIKLFFTNLENHQISNEHKIIKEEIDINERI